MTKTFADDKGPDAKSSSGRFFKMNVSAFPLLLLPALFQACHGAPVGGHLPSGRIRSVSASVPRIEGGRVSTIVLEGYGVCGKLQIDFGDGTPPLTISDFALGNPPQLMHHYRWGGTRTIKVHTLEDCVGGAQTTFRVPPNVIGYLMPRQTPCDIPSLAPLPKNATVHLTTTSDKISFGCLGGCSYDADGTSGTAPQGYPFFGLRPLSLVLKIGGGPPFQGGTDVTFSAPNGGQLEVCTNDYKTDDNKDFWRILLDVDYPGPP